MKTTMDLSAPLLLEAKRLAAAESTTVRELVEAGLRHVLRERTQAKKAFILPDLRVRGRGLTPEYADASWETIRDASYTEHGSYAGHRK